MKYIIASMLMVCAMGCVEKMSARETRTQNYSAFILSLYDQPLQQAQPTALVAPMRVAIAQVGELAPPQAMMRQLRTRPELFTRVEGIPGVFEESANGNQGGPLNANERQQVRERVGRLQRLAVDMGMDYLFIYGGSIEHYKRDNALEVLDFTIIGAFVVPSREIRAVGKAAGAMIDAHSGAVMFIASADTEQTKMATTSNQAGEELKAMENARESLTMRLAEQLTARCQEVALTRPGMPVGQ